MTRRRTSCSALGDWVLPPEDRLFRLVVTDLGIAISGATAQTGDRGSQCLLAQPRASRKPTLAMFAPPKTDPLVAFPLAAVLATSWQEGRLGGPP